MSVIKGRALHYVFKIGERKQTLHFYRNILGMKVLRHEEFAVGCEATCNGPYANRWSKTMVGYGPEDSHFVIELTYNYPIKSYKKGNDFIGISIDCKEALERAKTTGWPVINGNVLEAPGGYKFFINETPTPIDTDPVTMVTVASSNLQKSIDYWNSLLGLTIFEETDKYATLGFDPNQAKLKLEQIADPIDRAEAHGRIAYSVPFEQQEMIDEKIQEAGQKVLTPLISLNTPGKATVRVIILADPDEHEICFVDDENFRLLSQPDYESEKILDRYIGMDDS